MPQLPWSKLCLCYAYHLSCTYVCIYYICIHSCFLSRIAQLMQVLNVADKHELCVYVTRWYTYILLNMHSIRHASKIWNVVTDVTFTVSRSFGFIFVWSSFDLSFQNNFPTNVWTKMNQEIFGSSSPNPPEDQTWSQSPILWPKN